jgi:hypothetical protein
MHAVINFDMCRGFLCYIAADFSTAESGGQDLGGVVLLGGLVLVVLVVGGIYYNSL